MANVYFYAEKATILDSLFPDGVIPYEMDTVFTYGLSGAFPSKTSIGWEGYLFEAELPWFPGQGSGGSTAEIKIQIGGAWKDAGSIDVEGWA